MRTQCVIVAAARMAQVRMEGGREAGDWPEDGPRWVMAVGPLHNHITTITGSER